MMLLLLLLLLAVMQCAGGASYRERNCADTIDTVPVPWAGHFQY